MERVLALATNHHQFCVSHCHSNLPWLIKKINLTDLDNAKAEQQQELVIQQKIAQTSLQFLDKAGNGLLSNEHIANLHERLNIDLRLLNHELTETDSMRTNAVIAYQRTYLDLLQQQRNTLNALNHQPEVDEELIRKYLSLIDLEEFKVREKLVQEADTN